MNTYNVPSDRIQISAPRFNSRPVLRTINWQGLPVSVEIEIGDTKSGVDEGGKTWVKTYSVPYGEVPSSRTLADGDPVDVYLGPSPLSTVVYVIHQLKRDGSYDEDKCMLGFASSGEAVAAYKSHGPSWGFGSMDAMTVDQFKHGYLAANRRHS